MKTELRPTRRQFLKEAGLVAGGAAVSSLVMFSGCKTPSTTGTLPVTSPPTQNTTNPPNTTPVAETSSLQPATGFIYEPCTKQPPFIKITGCTT